MTLEDPVEEASVELQLSVVTKELELEPEPEMASRDKVEMLREINCCMLNYLSFWSLSNEEQGTRNKEREEKRKEKNNFRVRVTVQQYLVISIS